MRTYLIVLIAAFLAICASAVVQRQSVLVTYPEDTPQSVLDKAIEVVKSTGGIVTHEFKLIKGFAAQASETALETIKALGDEYIPVIENDSVVSIDGTLTEPAQEEVATGLLDWINSLSVAPPVSAISDLTDGVVLWKVLQRIDTLSFPGSLPEPGGNSSQWIPKWTNLKHIYDALSIFLIEECAHQLPLPSGAPDLKAVAQHSSLHDTVALLKLLVVAAINCNDRIDFLTDMQNLDISTQSVLMATAQEADEDESPDTEEREGPRPRSSESAHSPIEVQQSPRMAERARVGIDSDLAAEERLGRVLADNNRLAHEKRDIERQLDDAYARYERLQSSLERTQEELKETNERLTAVLAGRGQGTNRQDKQAESIIAALETRAIGAESELEELRKANELLKVRVERTQKLQDDYDEIKIDRDRLSRKANAADKYRQKLEASANVEKENESLKAKIGELQTQIRQSDIHSISTSDLQREIDEYRRLLPSIEQERHELNEMKKRLEVDFYTLEVRYQETTDQLQRSQQTVEELEGRLRDYEDGTTLTATDQLDHNVQEDLDKSEIEFSATEAKLSAALVASHSTEDVDSGISDDELRAIMSALRAQAQAGNASEREVDTRAQKKLVVALERSRSKNKELVDHVKRQSELIHDLQDPVKKLTPPSTSKEAKPSSPQPISEENNDGLQSFEDSDDSSQLEIALHKITNLERELRLMTSAWYAQQKQIASGAAGIANNRVRNGGETRSFLARQRRLVAAVALGGTRT
ncbi:hypothetical protein DV735_g5858, partial [Chaetothyriales sp. CBS 134920]